MLPYSRNRRITVLNNIKYDCHPPQKESLLDTLNGYQLTLYSLYARMSANSCLLVRKLLAFLLPPFLVSLGGCIKCRRLRTHCCGSDIVTRPLCLVRRLVVMMVGVMVKA